MSLGGDALEIHVSQKIGKCKVVNEKKTSLDEPTTTTATTPATTNTDLAQI